MLHNLIKWDAYGNYTVLEYQKTMGQCLLAKELEESKNDKEWFILEII
mgnify:CR=1 FL=1